MTEFEKWSLFLTGFGVLVGIGVLIIYGFQLKAMRHQLREMHRQSESTRAAAEAGKKSADDANLVMKLSHYLFEIADLLVDA